MSFQDVAGGPRRTTTMGGAGLRNSRSSPKIVAQAPLDEAGEGTRTKRSKNKRRSIVLHGKVHHFANDEAEGGDSQQDVTSLRSAQSLEQSRERLKRKSEFSRLAHETQQYQKMISELNALLDESGETPEAAWRAKIVLRSAQESDKELYQKLFDYEKTLLVRHKGNESELRAAQTSCMKLHRDFKRSHKALVMAMSTFEKRQAAEISRLGAVGWSSSRAEEKQEDFFDRAMREREAEVNQMRNSMHKVADIYQDLAQVVEGQQKYIDKLEGDIRYSKANVDEAERLEQGGFSCLGIQEPSFSCLSIQEPSFCGAMPFDSTQSEWGFLRELDTALTFGEEKTMDSSSPPSLDRTVSTVSKTRVSEDGFQWYMPFETFTEDLKSVQRDIFDLGRGVVAQTSKVSAQTNGPTNR